MSFLQIPSERVATSNGSYIRPPLNLYVSTSGSDSTGDGTSSNPWATIGKARDVIVSSSYNVRMDRDIVVNVAAGTYRITSTQTFTDAHSANNGFTITYRCSTAGGARIVASQQITSWTQYSGSIYRSLVSAATAPSTIYVNGERARKARFPKYVADSSYPMARATYLRAEGVDNSHTVLQYVAGNLSPGAWSLTDAQILMWTGGNWSWFTDTIPISSLNLGARQFTLSQSSRYAILQTGVSVNGSRYFAQGVLDLLTEPGEFHYDSATGYLYYWSTGNIANDVVEVPLLRTAVSLLGTSASARCVGVGFEGFSFENTDFAPWYRHAFVNEGDAGGTPTYPGYDRQMTLSQFRQGAVRLENATAATFSRCRFKNTGFSGIYAYGANLNHVVSSCSFERMGHSGIYMDGLYPGALGPTGAASAGDVNIGHRFYNCSFDRCGEQAGNGGGIALLNVRATTTTRCRFTNTTRYGYFVGAYSDVAAGDCYAKQNVLSYSSVATACQDSGDNAGIYFFGVSDQTNTINQVTVNNIYAHPSMTDDAPNGIFNDLQTNGQIYSNIQITNTQGVAWRSFASAAQNTTNVSWTGVFNAALMETANIGLVTGEYPF